jgi:hypothetical protein
VAPKIRPKVRTSTPGIDPSDLDGGLSLLDAGLPSDIGFVTDVGGPSDLGFGDAGPHRHRGPGRQRRPV